MNRIVLTSLIALSVTANVALIYKLSSASKAVIDKGNGVVATGVAALSSNKTKPSPTGTMNQLPTGQVPGGTWASLTGDGDLHGLVDRLRAAGYPATYIRAIVSSRLSEMFAEQRLALTPSLLRPFWVSTSTATTIGSPESVAAQRELSRQYTALLKELLGPDATSISPVADYNYARTFGNLPAEIREQLQQINQDYSEIRSIVQAESQGLTLAEDREKLAYLEAERRKDIAQLLTPEQYEDYMLRSSTAASQLRSQLAAFEPSEQEFRALYPLQERFDEQFGTNGNIPRNSPEYTQLRQAADRKLLEDAKALLGPERGAEFERARDGSFRSISALTKRLELPKENAIAVWELQKDIQARSNALRQDRSLTPEQRLQQQTALAAEANSKVIAALGERGHAAYQEMGGGWLRNIVPNTPPPTGPSPTSGNIGGAVYLGP